MSEVNVAVNGNSYDCEVYISASDGVVSEIILFSIERKDEGDVLFGAYYGSVGGGENDGGFFRMDIESSSSECLDYDEVDGLEEENPVHSSMLNALMQKLWTLVDDENGEVDLYMTDEGSKLYAPDETGVWMSSLFDGDALDQISNEWKLGLAFES
tara:strand:- start:62 stop:529 length:468 start_codon:yes stop_codon:yes gene_type:complete